MTKNLAAALLCLCLTILEPSVSLSQQASIPSAPEDIAQGQMDSPQTDFLEKLAGLYFAGEWQALQAAARKQLTGHPITTARNPGNPLYKFDFKNNFYTIVFSTNLRGTDEEIRFFAHDPVPEAYTQRLPGVSNIVEVFLSKTELAQLDTAVTSTQSPNPLAEKLSGFVSKQFDLSKLAGLFGFAGPSANQIIYAHISKIDLPFTRSTVNIEDRISITEAPGKKHIKEEIAKLEGGRRAQTSPCVRSVATTIKARVESAVDSLPKTTIPQQFAFLDETVSSALKEALGGALCRPAGNITESYIESESLANLEKQFRDVVAAPKPKEIKAKFSYENQPLERYSLGIVSSVIIQRTEDDVRVKISSETLVHDPLRGSLNLAVLNIHPRRYDPKTTSISPPERFRIFVGPSFTPEFGIGVGAGFGLVRGLSVNAGYSILRVDTAGHGFKLGDSVKDKKNPIKNGINQAFFVGFGFNF